MLKNCKTYWEAVDSICDNFAAVDAASGNNTLKVLTDEKTYLMIVNTKNGRTSMARCNRQDKFDYRIGLAVAWARYNNISVSINSECRLYNLSVGDSFTMHKSDSEEISFIVDCFTDDKKFAFCRTNYSFSKTGYNSNYSKLSCNTLVKSRVVIK